MTMSPKPNPNPVVLEHLRLPFAPPAPAPAAASSSQPASDPLATLGTAFVIGATAFLAGYAIAAAVSYALDDPERREIERSAKRHQRRGATVRADIAGWPRPPLIGGHIPDVFAWYPSGRVVVEEFENDRSVFSVHAERQHDAFSRWADRVPNRRRYTQIEIEGGRGGR
jgi:hypothetical protein